MATTSGTGGNLWKRTGSGIYIPATKSKFVRQGLLFYAPLWHPELAGSPFTSKELGGITCTATGTTWGTTGRTFLGDGYYITLGTNPLSSLTNANILSVEAWIYRYTDIRENIFGQDNTAGGLHIEIPIGGQLAALIPGTYVYRSTTTPVSISAWHHIVYTRSGTGAGTHSGYVDNVLLENADSNASNYSAVGTFILGRRAENSQSWNGIIGELRIYNRVLSVTEVAQNYYGTRWKYL